MPNQSGARAYDVVLYGASGFVGQQTLAYFAQQPEVLGRGLRWAIAGRSAEKLQALCQQHPQRTIGVVVADAQDRTALQRLASSTRVVLNTAGPFALYGSELVAACVRNGTHYVDITGETPWVRDLIAQHHAEAANRATRIIPMCGFDSVPSDLGVWLVQSAFARRYGTPCLAVKGAFSLRGGFNGGTLASMFNMYASGEADAVADPFLLNPTHLPRPLDPQAADPRAPRFDEDFDTWLAPFMMGPVNTRVVRRSAALLGYAPNFHYQEYQRMGRGAGAAAAASILCGGSLAAQSVLGIGPVRRLTQKLVPQPGQGPSVATMDAGSYRFELLASAGPGQQLRARVSDQGDPGNRATTKMLCESALALALQPDSLPGGRRLGGVLTPASGLGDVLVARLRSAGMVLAVDA